MPDDQPEEKPSTSEARPTAAASKSPAAMTTDFGDARGLNEEELKRLPKQTLATIARDESLPNRSKMNKAQLARTLRKHFRKAK